MKYIGVLDSGIGGLTVTEKLREEMPHENVVFIADTKNCPYGSKDNETIRKLVDNLLDKISQFDLKAFAFGCNTMDGIVGKEIAERLNIPVISIIEPTARKAALATINNKIAVLATEAAIRSNKYVECISKYNEDAEVYAISCPKLVPLAEDGRYSKDDKDVMDALNEYLKDVKDVDTLILGCTHYPYFTEAIKEIMDVNIISSSDTVVEEVKKQIKPETGEGSYAYYVTDNEEFFTRKIKTLLKKDLTIKKI